MYGVIHDYVGEAVIKANLPANTHKLFIWAAWHSKTGNRLRGYELETLRGWIDDNAPGTALKAVQTVQYSQRKAAEIFNGNPTEARRQTKRLVQAGILEPIGDTSKWHAQLYVIYPVAHTSRCDRERIAVTDTSRCDREGVTVADTFESHSGHISGLSRTHADAVTCDDAACSLITLNTSPAGAILSAKENAEKSPPICPNCESSDYVRKTESGSIFCDKCNTVLRA